ncbi:unnamed protein product [Calicophoron daubneyi]|uniref:Uncharacterized protein n=1 Tax=Calicophoron daubneyi TaxID=300641 RepID=A0AAV2T4X2_CALDB
MWESSVGGTDTDKPPRYNRNDDLLYYQSIAKRLPLNLSARLVPIQIARFSETNSAQRSLANTKNRISLHSFSSYDRRLTEPKRSILTDGVVRRKHSNLTIDTPLPNGSQDTGSRVSDYPTIRSQEESNRAAVSSSETTKSIFSNTQSSLDKQDFFSD